jgi:hypothetical protein
MTENGLFILGGPGMHLHDILWAVHDGKNHGRSDGEENFGEFPVTVGVLGNVACNFKKKSMLTQDLSRRCIATRGGECVHVPS